MLARPSRESTGRRPPFDVALKAWRVRLEAEQVPTEIRWAFRENLCIHHKTGPGGVHHLLYQLRWPLTSDAQAAKVYEHAAGASDCVAFQRLMSSADFSLCTLAGDPWESEDDDLDKSSNLYFTAGSPYERHTEIQTLWKWRWLRLRSTGVLSGLDFVLSSRRT